MQDISESINIVELLREKTEEADLRLCLKSSLGGFTRKSVLDYLALLRAHQQNTAAIFDQNLKSLFTEKETLKAENAALKEQLLKSITEYKILSESLRRPAVSEPAQESETPEAMRAVQLALEHELEQMHADNARLESENGDLRETISLLGNNLDQALKERKAGEGQLSREKEEAQELRDKVLELLATLDTQRSRVKFLEGQLSEQNIAQLRAEIAALQANLSCKTEVITAQNTDLQARNETIRTLENESKMLKLNTGYLSKSLESASLQNEKLSVANRELTEKLREEYQRALDSIHEKTDITVEKILAARKLEEANSRIASLEYQLEEKSAQETELQVLRKSCG